MMKSPSLWRILGANGGSNIIRDTNAAVSYTPWLAGCRRIGFFPFLSRVITRRKVSTVGSLLHSFFFGSFLPVWRPLSCRPLSYVTSQEALDYPRMAFILLRVVCAWVRACLRWLGQGHAHNERRHSFKSSRAHCRRDLWRNLSALRLRLNWEGALLWQMFLSDIDR